MTVERGRKQFIPRLRRRPEHDPAPAPRPYYYLGGNRALTQLSDGLPFFVNTDDRFITPWIVRLGEWESFVDRVLMRLAGPGMRACDVGANLGYYTVKLADRLGPDGHVLALEPNDAVFDFLVENIAVNGFATRVAARRVAIGSAPGRIAFNYASANLGSGTLLHMTDDVDPRRHEVELTTLDLLTAGQPGFDIIKIDVEGWEVEVLRGMRDTLARSPQASIVTEVSWSSWSRFGDPAEALREFIGDRDGVFVIRTDGRLERIPRDNVERFRQVNQCYALFTQWERTGASLEDLVA